MTREQLKSLTLVALFGLCTILVSQIWSGISITRLNPAKDFSSNSYATEQLSELIYPQSYVINFGGGSHTAMFSDAYGIWQTAKPVVLDAISERTAEMPLSEKEWQEMNQFRSVRFQLPVSLEPNILLQLSGREGSYSGKIPAIDTVLISAAKTGEIYVGDSKTKQYYGLDGVSAKIDIEGLLQSVEQNTEPEYETVEEHYRILNILQPDGGEALPENSVMVPRLEIKPMPILRIRGELPEFAASGDAQDTVRRLADAAFGNQFAFVNRLMDVNGAMVFLYGYGEKAFRIHPNGVMDYQEKPDTMLINKKTDLAGVLNRAITFIGRVGGYPEGIFLSGYEQTENKLGYKLRFSYPLEGVPVVSSADNIQVETPTAFAPIEIEVQGEQILFCKRRVGVVEGLLDVTPLWERALTMDEIIGKNYDRILPIYMNQSKDSLVDTSIQYRVLQSIRSVRLVYCQNNAGDRMTPAWEIDFSGAKIYFNIYDGRMMAVSS